MLLRAQAYPPLTNISNDTVTGRVSVNANTSQEASEQLEINHTQLNLSRGRMAWNRSPLGPENVDQVLFKLSEETVSTRLAPVNDHSGVSIVSSKLVRSGISEQSIGMNDNCLKSHTTLRSSSSSLIHARVPSSRFSSSTINGVPAKGTRNDWISKPIKNFFKRSSHRLNGKKGKNEAIDALSACTELASEKARPVVVQNYIDKEAAHPEYEVTSDACDVSLIMQDRASTRTHHGKFSGNRAKKQPRVGANATGPLSLKLLNHQVATGFEPPPTTRASFLSTTTSTSSSSEIKVPTNAELQDMADALSEINRLATQIDRTTRRRTLYAEDTAASKESASPSSARLHASIVVPMNSQWQTVESLLGTDHTNIEPPTFSHRQSTRSATAQELSMEHLTARDVPIEEDKNSTSSSDIEVPSDSQLQLLESLLCGSDQALSFSDSGIGLGVPDLSETKDPSLISASSSEFLVPTDSQMQLMEDLLCGKALSDPAPLLGLAKSTVIHEHDEAVDTTRLYLDIHGKRRSWQGMVNDYTCNVSIPLACSPKSASTGSSHLVVLTEADVHTMEDLFCGASANVDRNFPDSVAHPPSTRRNHSVSDVSSEIMAPTDAKIHAMKAALMSRSHDSSLSTEGESTSDPGACLETSNSSPWLKFIERDMLSAAGRAASARRSANRNARQTEKYNMQPKRSALHRVPDIVEIDRATGLPVKSDWQEVHFPEKELVQVVVIPPEPATVDMSYIVPDPDPVQMTADRVFLNTACLMPRTDVPGLRLDRVFPILNITSPRPVGAPPAPYRSTPVDCTGSLLPEFKVELPPECAPCRSPWANHNRFFDYDARVKSDPYTLGEHKELVLWRNRHRFCRRTSLYLPGVPFIIRDSKNVLKRASKALEDHICRLGLNKQRKLPMQMPVRSAMVHNAHFLRHTEAEECPCGKSKKLRRLDGWFKPTNISAYAITEVSQYAENGLRDPEIDTASSDLDTDKIPGAARRALANRVPDSLFACGAYRARQLAHPLVTEYSHLYDLHPRRIYVSFIPTLDAPGLGSVLRSDSTPISHLNNAPPPFDLFCPELVVPQLIVTSPSPQFADVPACSENSSGSYSTCPRELVEKNSALQVSCSVNSVLSLSDVCTQAVSRGTNGPVSVEYSYGVSVAASADHPIASYKVAEDSFHHIIEPSSEVLQRSRSSGVSSRLPAYSATPGLVHRSDPSANSHHELACHASGLSSNAADTLYVPSTTLRGSLPVPFIQAVTSRALFLPKPSLNDLGYHQA